MSEKTLKAVLRDILVLFPACVESCGRAATRIATCNDDCPDCQRCEKLYCDTCNVPLNKLMYVTWRDTDYAAIIRRANQALDLEE